MLTSLPVSNPALCRLDSLYRNLVGIGAKLCEKLCLSSFGCLSLANRSELMSLVIVFNLKSFHIHRSINFSPLRTPSRSDTFGLTVKVTSLFGRSVHTPQSGHRNVKYLSLRPPFPIVRNTSSCSTKSNAPQPPSPFPLPEQRYSFAQPTWGFPFFRTFILNLSATDREHRLRRHIQDLNVIRTVCRHEGPASLNSRGSRNIAPNLAAVERVKDREVAERLEGHLVLSEAGFSYRLLFLTLSITVCSPNLK
mgnify:CR=1 FL=1